VDRHYSGSDLNKLVLLLRNLLLINLLLSHVLHAKKHGLQIKREKVSPQQRERFVSNCSVETTQVGLHFLAGQVKTVPVDICVV